MPLSPVSITLTAPMGEGDSGSHTAHETRSLRHHIRLRTSSPASRKSLLSVSATANGDANHTETTTRQRARSRGWSGSSLLKHNVKCEVTPGTQQRSVAESEVGEAGEGTSGPAALAGSADSPSSSASAIASHYTIAPVDQSFVSRIHQPTHISGFFHMYTFPR